MVEVIEETAEEVQYRKELLTEQAAALAQRALMSMHPADALIVLAAACGMAIGNSVKGEHLEKNIGLAVDNLRLQAEFALHARIMGGTPQGTA